MKTKKPMNVAFLIAAASLTFSSSAWSLGLGDATVESFLNQPLQVKIDLLSRESDDLTAVTARLASASDYEMIGASLESISVPIKFAVEDIDGDAYILATSSLPVGEPVLRLIIEVNWSSGRLLREYTVFLDPPTFSEAAPIPRIDQRTAAPKPGAETPAEPTEQVTQESAEEVTEPTTAPREPVDGEYGPVSSGETLWGIASDWSRGTDLEINQVMIAIQRENPQAFMRDNINLLKRGAILRMPRAEDVRAISLASANQSVALQEDLVRGRDPAPTMASPTTPLLAEATNVSEMEESLEMAEEAILEEEMVDEAEAEEALAEDIAAQEPELSPQLELVPPSEESELDSAYGFEESESESADVAVAVTALREDLARTEEDLITQQQQNEYLAERIKELESQLASTEEGNVENANMANMEDRLREQRLADAAAAKKKETPWYSSVTAWLIGLLILAAAGVGWWLSRRSYANEFAGGADDGQIREIKDEAEDLLRVLDDSEKPEATEAVEDAAEKPQDESAVADKKQKDVKPSPKAEEDAEVLDEESSDPEIQLDLARAYISMGDKEAARVILEEVGNNGNEEQRAEAKKMLDLLIP